MDAIALSNPNEGADIDQHMQRYLALVDEYLNQFSFDASADCAQHILDGMRYVLEVEWPDRMHQRYDKLCDLLLVDIVPASLIASPAGSIPAALQRDISTLIKARAEACLTEELALGKDAHAIRSEVQKWQFLALSNLPDGLDEVYREDQNRIQQGLPRLVPKNMPSKELEALWCRTANLLSYPADEFAWRLTRFVEIYDTGAAHPMPYALLTMIEGNPDDAGGLEREIPSAEVKPSGSSIFGSRPGTPPTSMPKSGGRPKRPPIGA